MQSINQPSVAGQIILSTALPATDNSIKLSHINLYFTILHICHQLLVIHTTATLKRDNQTSQGSTRMAARKTDSIE